MDALRSGRGSGSRRVRSGSSPAFGRPLVAVALTRIDTASAGRAYAAYGGVYILSSLLWMWAVKGARPDRWDAAGAGVCLAGAGIHLFALDRSETTERRYWRRKARQRTKKTRGQLSHISRLRHDEFPRPTTLPSTVCYANRRTNRQIRLCHNALLAHELRVSEE